MMIIRNETDIPKGRPLYIYGAGQGGVVLLRTLKARHGFNVVGFLDSFKSGEFFGKPVIAFDGYLARRSDQDVILIASQYVMDIVPKLRQAGVSEYHNAHPLVMSRINRQRRQRVRAVLAALAATAAALLFFA